jgi:hypothetical protein
MNSSVNQFIYRPVTALMMEPYASSVVTISAGKCIVPTPNPTWFPVASSVIFQRYGVPGQLACSWMRRALGFWPASSARRSSSSCATEMSLRISSLCCNIAGGCMGEDEAAVPEAKPRVARIELNMIYYCPRLDLLFAR